MAAVIAGLVGGLVATIVMTIVMMVRGDGGPPPTAALVAKFADGDPDDYAMPGMVLHLLYGIVAGAVFAVAVATSVFVLGIAAVAGAVVHAFAATPVWYVVTWSIPGVVGGGTIGTHVGKYVPNEVMEPALGLSSQ